MTRMRVVAVVLAVVGILIAPASPLVGHAEAAAPAELLTNGSFETGDFTGWGTKDMADPYEALGVFPAGFVPVGSYFAWTPTDGSFVAGHGFDGGGPDTIEMWQDVTIPARHTAELKIDWRAGWEMIDFGTATLDRTLDVVIEPAGGGAALSTTNILTAVAPSDNFDTGPMSATVDLSGFAGMGIRVNLVVTIPEPYTGPGQMQIDNASLLEETPPGLFEVVGEGARIVVEDTTPVTAPRTLFELINNGLARFVFTDSDTGNKWQFSQNGNGNFTVSRINSVGPSSGLGGPELLIAKNGRVKMGPGGDTTFDLLANGNLTITGALTENSDLSAKTAIADLDSRAVLEAVLGLPIAEWSYSDDPGVRHVGPMAQDFYAAFGLGADETGIATLDTSGVALASIQALAAENEALDTRVTWMMWLMGALLLGLGVGHLRRRRQSPV